MLSEFFYPSRRLGISSPREVRCISSALRAVSHHASACILLRLNEIQSVPLWWYTSPCGIDDIHAFGVICCAPCKRIDKPPLLCYAKTENTKGGGGMKNKNEKANDYMNKYSDHHCILIKKIQNSVSLCLGAWREWTEIQSLHWKGIVFPYGTWIAVNNRKDWAKAD